MKKLKKNTECIPQSMNIPLVDVFVFSTIVLRLRFSNVFPAIYDDAIDGFAYTMSSM